MCSCSFIGGMVKTSDRPVNNKTIVVFMQGQSIWLPQEEVYRMVLNEFVF